AANQAADGAATDEKFKAQLGMLLDEFDITIERAMTEKARVQAEAIRVKIAALGDAGAAGSLKARLIDIDTDLAKLVQKYASDGLVYRSRADDLIDRSDRLLMIA